MATYGLLFKWVQKFEAWQYSGEPEFFLHRKQIEAFYHNHKLHIDLLNTAIEQQNEKYFVHKDGKMIVDNNQPVFKDITQKEEYAKELNELMQRKVQIVFAGSTI